MQLAHLVDGDARIPEAGGDLGQRAGFVEQRHPQVIGRGRGRAGGDRRRKLGGRNAEGRHADAAGDVDHIGHDRAGRGSHPGTGAAQDDLADRIAFQHDHVRAALQLAQRRGRGDKAGRHALLQPAPGHLRHAQKLDPVAHVLGQADVVDGDVADAFQLHGVKADTGAEGDGRQKRKLVARVDAADIKLGVGLQIAKLAGLFKDHVIGQARRLHPGQDVVAGAVHHAHDALDPVGGQTFGQGLDHRDAPGDGGLEPQGAAPGFGSLGQGLTVMG